MNIKRIGRILVCLLLVCCLLVTCPPVQAYAMSPGVAAAIIIGVPAALVIGSALIGQGILPGIGDAFNNLINDIKMSVAVQRFIYDDKIDVLASTNTATDETQYYVSQDVLEAVQEAAFETGAISVSDAFPPLIPAGEWVKGGRTYIKAPVDAYAFAIYPKAGYSSLYLCLASTVPFDSYTAGYYNGTSLQTKPTETITYNDLTVYYTMDITIPSAWTESNAAVYNGNNALYIAQVLSGEIPYGESKITLADGLVQGAVVGSNAISFPEAYPDWADKSIEQDDPDNPIPFFPIGLGNTYEETISKSQEDVWNGVSEYTAAVLDNWTSLLDAISAIKTFVGNIAINIGSWFENVISKIEELPSKFAEWFNNIAEKLERIGEQIQTLGQTIVEGIKNVLSELFSPSEDFLMNQVEALKAKHHNIDNFNNLGNEFKAFFAGLGSTPPIIYIDLGAATGSYLWGGRQVFLDLTWYSEYKSKMDFILGGIIWLWLAWRVFLSIPGIINGESGTWGARNEHADTHYVSGPLVTDQKMLSSGRGSRRFRK